MPSGRPPQILEFHRRLDGLVYRFRPDAPRAGVPTWKREDLDLWVVKVERLGWVCVDNQQTVLSIPWALAVNEQGGMPPAGEWVSKKGDKSYVYNLVYGAPESP